MKNETNKPFSALHSNAVIGLPLVKGACTPHSFIVDLHIVDGCHMFSTLHLLKLSLLFLRHVTSYDRKLLNMCTTLEFIQACAFN